MDARSLKSETVQELRRIAAELQIPGRAKMRKDDLIDAILAARAAAPAATGTSDAKSSSSLAIPDKPGAKSSSALAVPEKPTPGAAIPGPRKPVSYGPDDEDDLSEAETLVNRKAVRTEPPGEPSEWEVFIDRGLPLPQSYEGSRLRLIVRDPETLFVYWEVPWDVPRDAWEVIALGEDDEVLFSFRVGPHDNRGYLQAPPEAVRRVLLRPVFHGVPATAPPTLVLDVPPAPAPHEGPAPWVEVPREVFDPRDIEERFQRALAEAEHYDRERIVGHLAPRDVNAPVADPTGWTPRPREQRGPGTVTAGSGQLPSSATLQSDKTRKA